MSRESSKKAKPDIPDWVGNYPFPPEKKEPVVINRQKSILFTYGQGLHKVSCTTAISTNYIQSGIMIICPGEYFTPPDIHSGNEVYYVLQGQTSVLNPETGRASHARQGEVVLIPKGIWHQSFNTGNDNLEVLAFIAPLQWQKGDSEVPAEYKGKARYYQGRAGDSAFLGQWPPGPEKPVADDEIKTVGHQDTLNLVHGKEKHFSVSFYVSDELIHVGEMNLPMRISSEPEEHKGDEIIYTLEGYLGVQVYKNREDEVSTVHDVYEVREREWCLIPAGIRHSYFNFSDRVTRTIFSIAPQL